MSIRQGLYGEKKEVIYLQADATSLADLKAETVRKKTEAVQNRQKGNYRPEKNNEKKKKANIWSKENSGLIARMQRDMEVKAEEERTWQKSKSIMERKSKIYDSLKESKGRSEVSSRFLVEFDRRSDSDSDSDDGRRRRDKDYPAKDDREQWVEYTDSLGRTRTCMKKDLKRLQGKNDDLSKRDDSDSSSSEDDSKRARHNSGEEPDLLSEDMRRDMLRQKWEKEELENLEKDSLHYSDVRFDEARNHGAGFYAFSRDQDKRSKEQVTLKNLHAETNDARREKEKKAEKRKREMAERVRKIKQKRREKMGLPPLEDEEPDKPEQSDSDNEADFTKSVEEGLKMFRRSNEAEEKRKNEIKRREDLRDWDVGKEGLDEMKKEWKVLTQQEWNDKQRSERNQEFAPPTAFNEARTILQKKEEDFIKSQDQKRKSAKANHKLNPFTTKPLPQVNQFPAPPPSMHNKFSVPPPTVDQLITPPPPFQQFNVPPPPVNSNSARNSVKLDPMSMLNTSSGPSSSVSGPVNKPSQSYSTAMRLDLHRKMMEQDYLPASAGLNSRIINELVESVEEDDEEEEEEEDRRGLRNEIAPPCSMDYYSSQAGPSRNKSMFKSREDIASAFNQGLNALKK